jgi:phosphate transport system ATP-binding protein
MSQDVLDKPAAAVEPRPSAVRPKMEARNLSLYYGSFQALKEVNVSVAPRSITAFIGPSGCGKSTILRCLDRMNDLIKGVRVEGQVLLDGRDIYAPKTDLIALRKRVGMVFQRPNPFPISVFENVAYGPRVHGELRRNRLEEMVERSLKATDLWIALKDKLGSPALALPPETQQRLCISRLLAVEPDVLLMDEPCSSLDPIATARVEELLFKLQSSYSIVIVTHNMQQAARVAKWTAYFLLGEMVEFGETGRIFTAPKDLRTEQYITGRFG